MAQLASCARCAEWIAYMDNEQKRRWTAHCRRMAEATYALADWCDDPQMMASYVALGAKWVQMADVRSKSDEDGDQSSSSLHRDIAA